MVVPIDSHPKLNRDMVRSHLIGNTISYHLTENAAVSPHWKEVSELEVVVPVFAYDRHM
jgi:hypothetical protein